MGNANWNLDIKGGRNILAFIYEIVNDVNNKRYIGKTEFDINKRFQEHCNDAFKERNAKRPLYRAMRKYGIEHFHISLIEETDSPEEREIYWINEKKSFHNGYNATIGGDGKRFLDYDLIIKTYKEVQNLKETARICGVSSDSVKNILKLYSIPIKSSMDIARETYQKAVAMYNNDDHSILIKTFVSPSEAAEYLIENEHTTSSNIKGIGAHIIQVCNDKRASAYGYFWGYLN